MARTKFKGKKNKVDPEEQERIDALEEYYNGLEDARNISKYGEHMDEKAFQLCLRYGCSLPELADKLGVHIETVHRWRRVHASFKAAVRDGWDGFAVSACEKAIVTRATGYDKEVVSKAFSQRITPQGELVNVEEERVQTIHVPADTAAAKFVLKNRAPELYPDSKEVKMGGIAGGAPIEIKNGVSAEEAAKIYQEAMKATNSE